MGTYQHSATIRTNPDTLYGYLTDVDNLPEYFSAMTRAERTGENEVYVVAEVEGTQRDGHAWFELDPVAYTMTWGAEGPNDYHGRLEIAGEDGAAIVTVTLHTERADGPGIRAGLESTLANIKRQMEGSSTEAVR